MTCHCCYIAHRQHSRAFCSSPTSCSVNSDTVRVFRFDEGTVMRQRAFGSRCFETTQLSHLEVSKCPKKNSGTFRHLKMWPLYCFETSGNRISGDAVLCPITTVALSLGAFANLPKAPVSFVMSVRPSTRNNSAPTGRICRKFGNWVFLKICLESLCLIELWQE